ncbi:MAG: hypothetical protein EZS28_050817, partial [Streblomastix strix]
MNELNGEGDGDLIVYDVIGGIINEDELDDDDEGIFCYDILVAFIIALLILAPISVP